MYGSGVRRDFQKGIQKLIHKNVYSSKSNTEETKYKVEF